MNPLAFVLVAALCTSAFSQNLSYTPLEKLSYKIPNTVNVYLDVFFQGVGFRAVPCDILPDTSCSDIMSANLARSSSLLFVKSSIADISCQNKIREDARFGAALATGLGGNKITVCIRGNATEVTSEVLTVVNQAFEDMVARYDGQTGKMGGLIAGVVLGTIALAATTGVILYFKCRSSVNPDAGLLDPKKDLPPTLTCPDPKVWDK